MGEKTGWTYIRVPAPLAQQLMPGNKKSFRVKGKLDNHRIKGLALIPMGEGDFILALKAELRKTLGKQKGATLMVAFEVDKEDIKPPAALLECLEDEPAALKYFNALPRSHQNYFGNWIKTAKTEATKTKRIAMVVNAMIKKQDFASMLKDGREDRQKLMGG